VQIRWQRRRLLKLALSLILLAAIYTSADWSHVGHALATLDPWYLFAAFLLFIPQTLVSAFRWQLLVRPFSELPFTDSLRQILAASAYNLVLPSKLGDFSKALQVRSDDEQPAIAGGGMMVLGEKLADVLALLVLWFLGALGLSARGTSLLFAALLAWAVLKEVFAPATFPSRRASIRWVAVASLLLWTLHLVQINLCLQAADVFVPWHIAVRRIPAALFIGLLPIGLWGIGTRDAALIWLFDDVAPASTMAAVGLLTALRYLIPGLCGIPFAGGKIAPPDFDDTITVEVSPTRDADSDAAIDPDRIPRLPDRP
jgi:hypothetical protein